MSQVIETKPIELADAHHSQALVTSESSRTLGEIQAMLTVAASRPRNEPRCIEKITNACQRQRLAELSEYSYSKGGQAITGATIRLLEVIGQNWGNMTWGFRELSQIQGKESTVQAYAWDLENNVKITRDFVVSHSIKSRENIKTLTDPREIYELVANQAQRRVRTCLENCIPKDVIEDARDACQKTLIEKCVVTPERIKTMQDKFFEKFHISKDQLEARIQRRLSAIQPAQFLSLGRIFNSIQDGMSEPKDWFEFENKTSLASITDQINGEDELKAESATATDDISVMVEQYISKIEEAKNSDELNDLQSMSDQDFSEVEPEQRKRINKLIVDAATDRAAELAKE